MAVHVDDVDVERRRVRGQSSSVAMSAPATNVFPAPCTAMAETTSTASWRLVFSNWSEAVVSHTVSSKQSPSRTDWSSGALADEIAAVSAVERIRLRSRDSSGTEGREQVADSEERGGHDGRSRVVRMLTHLVGPIHSGTLASAMMLRIACTRSGRWHPLRRGVLLSEAGNRTSESGTLA